MNQVKCSVCVRVSCLRGVTQNCPRAASLSVPRTSHVVTAPLGSSHLEKLISRVWLDVCPPSNGFCFISHVSCCRNPRTSQRTVTRRLPGLLECDLVSACLHSLRWEARETEKHTVGARLNILKERQNLTLQTETRNHQVSKTFKTSSFVSKKVYPIAL